jgi:GntR family transcriptional regulator
MSSRPPTPRIRVNPSLPVPIWSQIEDGVRQLVATGALGPGAAMPSVRDLARAERINPNTAAKAYQRLVDAGVLETRRGEGTFVAERPPSIPAAERSRTLREGAARYASLASNLGASRSEAATVLNAAWPDGDERGGRK